MKKAVWKYPTRPGPQTVPMPEGAQLLAIGPDPEKGLAVWALVDMNAPLEDRTFFVVGTGWEMEEGVGEHIDTVCVGGFVWHLFDPRGEVTP